MDKPVWRACLSKQTTTDLVPGYSSGSVVPTGVAFTSCWRHQHQRTNP
jgi:hypothetical protein